MFCASLFLFFLLKTYRYKPKPGVFVKQFPAGATVCYFDVTTSSCSLFQTTGRLNTSTTRARYVDTHTMASDYGY